MPKISRLPVNTDVSPDDLLVMVDTQSPRSVTKQSPVSVIIDLTKAEIGTANASGDGLLSVAFWTDLTNATWSAIPSTLVKRDSSGRFQAAQPAVNADVTTKQYVDDLVSDAVRIHKQTVTGAVTTFNVDHNFGTRDVVVQIYDLSSNDTIMADVVRSSINQVQISFSSPPGASSFRVLVQA